MCEGDLLQPKHTGTGKSSLRTTEISVVPRNFGQKETRRRACTPVRDKQPDVSECAVLGRDNLEGHSYCFIAFGMG